MDVWLVHIHKPNGNIYLAHVLEYSDNSQLIEETVDEFGWQLTRGEGTEPGGMETWEATDAHDRVRMTATKVEVKETAIKLGDTGVAFED